MAYDNYKLGSEALCAKTEQGSTPRVNERLVARVPGMNTVGENSPHSGTAERGWWDDTFARGKIAAERGEGMELCAMQNENGENAHESILSAYPWELSVVDNAGPET